MVLDKSVYNDANYWNGGITGTRLAWGYTGINGYLESLQDNNLVEGESVAFNGELRKLWDRIQGQSFTNAKVLEIGGATGYLSKIAKYFFPSVTYDMIDISDYWINDIEPTVDTFFNVDVVTKAQETGQNKIKNNAYDVLISRLTLECLTDAELAIVIPKLNDWCSTQQVHIFSNPDNLNQATKDQQAYNEKTLAEWALMGFESGTILQDRSGNEVVVA
jgi:hypothetical protein